MLARRIRNSLAVIGALLPFAAFAEGQPRKTVAVGNTEGRQNMSIEQHAQGTAAATVRTSDATARVAPALERYSERVLGELWRRPGLSPRDRGIVTIAVVIARNQTIEMPYYFDLALDNGVKPAELAEAITHLAFYAGWPNVFSALPVAKDVFEKRPR